MTTVTYRLPEPPVTGEENEMVVDAMAGRVEDQQVCVVVSSDHLDGLSVNLCGWGHTDFSVDFTAENAELLASALAAMAATLRERQAWEAAEQSPSRASRDAEAQT